MKNATEQAKALDDLMASLPEGTAPEFAEARDPVAVLVLSFLMWEATTDQALKAYAKLRERIVDFNDLRMNMAHETIDAIGPGYPLALERSRRMRAALRHVYNRQHEVSLEAVEEMGRREARKYIESLDGIVPYVSARLLLLSFGAHAVPADDRLCNALAEAGVVEDDADGDAATLSAWLTRQIKSADGVEAHFKLQAYADEHGGSTRKRTTKKTKRKKKTSSGGSRNAAKKKASGSGGNSRSTSKKSARKKPTSKKKTKA